MKSFVWNIFYVLLVIKDRKRDNIQFILKSSLQTKLLLEQGEKGERCIFVLKNPDFLLDKVTLWSKDKQHRKKGAFTFRRTIETIRANFVWVT